MFSFEPETEFIVWLQSLPEPLLTVMQLFTLLGNGAPYIFVFALVYWCFDARFGLRLFLILILGGAVNAILKMGLTMPRPYWMDDRIQAVYTHASFGMPSGHAQTAAATLGLVGHRLKRKWVWALMAGLIFLIGFSRIPLGVHYPSQVLVGWAVGFTLLVAFLLLEKPLMASLMDKSMVTRAAVCVGGSLLILGGGLLIVHLNRSFRLPEGWIANAPGSFSLKVRAHPLQFGKVLSVAGALLGLSLGGVWTFTHGGLEPAAGFRRIAARGVVGLAGLCLFLLPLFLVTVPGHGTAAGLRYLGGLVAGLWIVAGAPELFRKLGL